MKVSIQTIREFPSDLFWSWADATLAAMRKVDPNSQMTTEHFAHLFTTGQLEIHDPDKAGGGIVTIYQILER